MCDNLQNGYGMREQNYGVHSVEFIGNLQTRLWIFCGATPLLCEAIYPWTCHVRIVYRRGRPLIVAASAPCLEEAETMRSLPCLYVVYIYSRRHKKVSVPFCLPFHFIVISPCCFQGVTVFCHHSVYRFNVVCISRICEGSRFTELEAIVASLCGIAQLVDHFLASDTTQGVLGAKMARPVSSRGGWAPPIYWERGAANRQIVEESQTRPLDVF